MTFGSAAQIGARASEFEETIGNSLIVKEPVGVVGCITPWNYPLHQIAAKVAPALAAGCTVVLKPSEVAPLSAFILAEIIDAARLPRGVFNLVSGDGGPSGEAHRRPPRHRHGELHRVDARRKARERGRVEDRQARGPRARRQEREHHPRRRGPRQGRQDGRAELLPQLGADVLGLDAHARAEGEARRGRGRSRRRRPRSSRRAIALAAEHAPRSAHLEDASRSACAATSARASKRARRSSTGGARSAGGSAEGVLREADGLRRT